MCILSNKNTISLIVSTSSNEIIVIDGIHLSLLCQSLQSDDTTTLLKERQNIQLLTYDFSSYFTKITSIISVYIHYLYLTIRNPIILFLLVVLVSIVYYAYNSSLHIIQFRSIFILLLYKLMVLLNYHLLVILFLLFVQMVLFIFLINLLSLLFLILQGS